MLGNVTTTPLASANITGSSYDQYAQSRIAVQEAQRQQLAQARQEADIQRLLDQEDAFNAQQAAAQNYANEQAAAAQRMAAEKAAQLAHEQAMIAAQKSTVNSGGNGTGAAQRAGGYAKSKAPGEAGSRFGL